MRLSGESGGFLSLELPIQPMSSIVLMMLRPATAADGSRQPIDLDYLRGHMASRLDELPAFRWQVKPVPFGLHHPVFVEEPGFDLGFHLREHLLPEPGGPDQLDRYCACLAEQSLDREHPLWQLVLVQGMQDGRQALVLRVHHCLMDGFATLGTLSCILAQRDKGLPALPVSQSRPAATASSWRLISQALGDQARSLRRLPALVRKTVRSQSEVRERQSGAIAVPKPGVDAPASAINQAFTAERRFARTWVPLAPIKLVKRVAGGSVNDVALAIVAGSLRSYLEGRDALPVRPLIATVPVGMELPDASPRTYGNRFSGMVISLATDIAEPWDRLAAIVAGTTEAKQQLAIRGPELLPDWLEMLPPALMDRAVRRNHRKRCKGRGKIDVNVVVSNLRGPRPGGCVGSAEVEEIYVAGPPNNGVGTNVVLMDCGDRMFFSFLCFADSVEAPEELAHGLHQSLGELVKHAEAHLSEARLTSDPSQPEPV